MFIHKKTCGIFCNTFFSLSIHTRSILQMFILDVRPCSCDQSLVSADYMYYNSPVYLKQQNCAHINNKAGTSLLTLDPLEKNKKILIPNRKSEKLAVYFGVNDEISIRFLYWKDFRTQFCVIFRYLSDVATYDSTCFWNPLNWLHYRRNFFLEIHST